MSAKLRKNLHSVRFNVLFCQRNNLFYNKQNFNNYI